MTSMAAEQPIAARVEEAAAAEIGEREYAGFVTRVIAFAVDAAVIDGVAILVGTAVALIFSVLPVSDTFTKIVLGAGGVAFVLWWVGYFVTFWNTTGQTPGNRVMHIRVARTDGSMLDLRHAVLRLAGMLISLPFLWGFVPILLDDRRRGVFDRLAGTVVIRADQ